MKRNIVVPLVAAMVLLTAVTVFAANPADLTSDVRLCPVHYYKVVYDDGPWYVFAAEPIGKDASVILLNWNDKACASRQYELAVTKRMNSRLQLGFIGELWDGETTEDMASLMVDYTVDRLSIGVITPIVPDGETRIGPRLKLGREYAAYLTFAKDAQPVQGITFRKKGLQLDLAAGCDTWWFRASLPDRKVIPELRTKFTKDETIIGFGLAYCPD